MSCTSTASGKGPTLPCIAISMLLTSIAFVLIGGRIWLGVELNRIEADLENIEQGISVLHGTEGDQKHDPGTGGIAKQASGPLR